MVSNPPHHPRGDFSLNGDRLEFEGNRMTYSGVSVLNPEIFQGIEEDAFPLRWALERAITAGLLGWDLECYLDVYTADWVLTWLSRL